MKNQLTMYWEAHKKISALNRVFLNDILPTITFDEFNILCTKRPDIYEKFRGLVMNVKR